MASAGLCCMLYFWCASSTVYTVLWFLLKNTNQKVFSGLTAFLQQKAKTRGFWVVFLWSVILDVIFRNNLSDLFRSGREKWESRWWLKATVLTSWTLNTVAILIIGCSYIPACAICIIFIKDFFFPDAIF